MKRKLLGFSLCLIWVVQVILVWDVEANRDAVDLVILHMNDTHGHLQPFDTSDQKDVGGIARLATLVQQIRQDNDGRVLLLHAGDIFSRGDALTVYYGGEINLRAMDRIGYDVLTPGNGEFYPGVENLIRQTSFARLPVTLANVTYRKSGSTVFAPYVIKDIAGVKVAVLGLGFIRENHPSSRPLSLQNPIEVAKKHVPLLREKADLVIALTHIGLRADSALAVEVPQIDVIVGGHSHSRLDAPLYIPKPGGQGKTVVAQAGGYGRFLGRLDVRLKRVQDRYHVIEVEGRLLPIDGSISEDAEVTELLEYYSVPLEEGVCVSEISLENPSSGDSPMGNLVVRVLRSQTRADIALLDRGAVRHGIEVGEVTAGDIYRIHPWRNKVLSLVLTGSQIGHILGKHDILTDGCRFRRTEHGIEGLDIGGAPVDSTQSYMVVAGDFLVTQIPSLRDISFDETGWRVNTSLRKYFKQVSVIRQ